MQVRDAPWVSIGVTARYLGLSCDTLRLWCHNDQLPPGAMMMTGGGHRRFHLPKLLSWLKHRDQTLIDNR